ncbi:MAG: ATP-grasp domain-containing protein [Parachlamydiales bacterium]|nr:ATP-grasp domain-containing protein [Parachlamydiales bacterium]
MDAVVLFDAISSATPLKTAASQLGFKVIAVYTRPLSIYETEFHLDEKALKQDADLTLFSDNLEWIYQKIKESRFTLRGSIPGLDSGVELADQIALAFQLPGNRIDLSSARRDKGKMRAVQKQEGFSCPDFAVCQTEKEIKNYVRTHPFPLVIKTPRGAGTSHVYVCDDLENLLEKFRIIQKSENLFGEIPTHAVVEDFIGGNEYIVNTFSDGEKVHVTDLWIYEKLQTEAFKNITTSAILLPFSGNKEMQEMGKRIAEGFGISRGPAHLEMKKDPIRGPTLIELAARLCGARLPFYVKKYSNFDPYRATIEVFTKGSYEVPEPIVFSKQIALALCPIFKVGMIQKIIGIEEIQKLSSYETHQLNVKIGDLLQPTTYLTTTPLVVFLAHKDREQLLKDLKKVHQIFQIDVK